MKRARATRASRSSARTAGTSSARAGDRDHRAAEAERETEDKVGFTRAGTPGDEPQGALAGLDVRRRTGWNGEEAGGLGRGTHQR